MAGECALHLSLLVLVVADTRDTENPLLQESQVRYLSHGIQLSNAPYPGRRNLGFGHKPQPSGPAAGIQLFGDPLPGDNRTSLTRIPSGARMHPFRPGHMSQSQQDRAEGFGPDQVPNGHDMLALDAPLVTRQALGPPPPSVDLSHLAKISHPRTAPFKSGQSAYGFPPPAPFDLSQLSQTGLGVGPSQMLGGHRPMNPWYGLPIPTPMGPYHRRLKPKPMSPPVELQPPLSPLRDIDDPRKRASKVPMPYDSWRGAQEGRVVPPPAPAPAQLAPLAPPRAPARNPGHLRQGGNDAKQEYFVSNMRTMLRNIPRFHEISQEPSTRWQYKRVPSASLEEASSKPPPALLSKEDGLMEELSPESNDNDASLSDAAGPVKSRPPSNTFDYILL